MGRHEEPSSISGGAIVHDHRLAATGRSALGVGRGRPSRAPVCGCAGCLGSRRLPRLPLVLAVLGGPSRFWGAFGAGLPNSPKRPTAVEDSGDLSVAPCAGSGDPRTTPWRREVAAWPRSGRGGRRPHVPRQPVATRRGRCVSSRLAAIRQVRADDAHATERPGVVTWARCRPAAIRQVPASPPTGQRFRPPPSFARVAFTGGSHVPVANAPASRRGHGATWRV